MNEGRVSFTDQFDFNTPSTANLNIPAAVGWKYAQDGGFPYLNINGTCCFGGNVQPGPTAVYREFTYDPSDVVTLIRGRHVLKFGGEIFFMQCDCTTWNNVNSGTFNYDGLYTAGGVGNDPGTGQPWTTESGVPYADFLLGISDYWQASYAPPFHARMKTPQIFAEDTMKLRPNLTLDAGLRWQGITGIEDTNGDMYSFDPTVMNPATNTLGAMWYASTHANGRTNLQKPVWNTFLPRVGFSYQMRPDLVIRGGYGLFAYGWSHDCCGGGDGSAYASSGTLPDSTNGAEPVSKLSDTGNTVYPGQSSSVNGAFILPTTNPAAFNGQSQVNTQYNTPISENEQWSLEVQQGLGANMVASIAYVGSHGRNLQFFTDINAVPASKLGPNDNPTGRPYPQFQNLGGPTYNAVSNYNSLQATITRRMSNGLAFSFNFTWSHFLSDQDSAGWGTRGGSSPWQNAYVPSANYGNSNFDVPRQFKGDVIYTLPFGQGQRFLHSNQFVDYAIGGWHISAIFIDQAGNPFTPVMANNQDFSQDGNQYPNVVGNPTGGTHGTLAEWFNVSAYASPGAGVFGNMRRNSVFGPGLNEINASLGKSFHIWHESSFLLRGDATNALNHPSFAQPDNNIGPGHTGAINGVTVGGRSMQLVAKVQF